MTREDAFIGLEAAIVMIAFVTVASVFSYVVMGAGFTTTQKSQQVVHAADGQTTNVLELMGNVYGIADTDGGPITKLQIAFNPGVGTEGVDMSKVVFSIATDSKIETLTRGPDLTVPAPGEWTIRERRNNLGELNDQLQRGEEFIIEISPSIALAPGEQFTLEVRPPAGAGFSIRRTIPTYPQKTNILY